MKPGRAFLYFVTIFLAQLLIAPWGYGQIEPDPDWLAKRLSESATQMLGSGLRVEVGEISTLAPVAEGASVLLVSPGPPLGVISFSANWLDHGSFRSTHGTASIRAYGRVAVARSPLRPGDPLSEANTVFQERELGPYAQSGYFLNWDQLRQVRARGFTRPGMVLGSFNTELPIPMHQGEVADLFARRGNLVIVAKVRALENGQIDQRIRVQNITTNKILLARVSGPGELQLR